MFIKQQSWRSIIIKGQQLWSVACRSVVVALTDGWMDGCASRVTCPVAALNGAGNGAVFDPSVSL